MFVHVRESSLAVRVIVECPGRMNCIHLLDEMVHHFTVITTDTIDEILFTSITSAVTDRSPANSHVVVVVYPLWWC